MLHIVATSIIIMIIVYMKTLYVAHSPHLVAKDQVLLSTQRMEIYGERQVGLGAINISLDLLIRFAFHSWNR